MFTLLSKKDCPQCDQAVALLKAKDKIFTKKMLDEDYDMQYLKGVLATASTPTRTFPVVIKDGEVVGGLQDLMKLLK